MIQAVFFDYYGTLAGFSPTRYEIQSEACAPFGIELTPEGVLRGYAKADAFMSRQNAAKPLGQLDAEERRSFFAEYERLVLEGSGVEVSSERAGEIWRSVRQVRYALRRFDDVLPAMDLLRVQGLALGLISNMDSGGGELAERLGLSAYLDFTITSGEVGVGKPHAPIFLAALSKGGRRAPRSAARGRPAHVGRPGCPVGGHQPGPAGQGRQPPGVRGLSPHRDPHGAPGAAAVVAGVEGGGLAS